MSGVAGIIPARWASSRFPGKMLTPLCGKPLIQWVWERARAARRLNYLGVATDDERIEEAVRSFGGETIRTRPDHPSGTDRVAEAVAGLAVDGVVNIQGDEPLIDPLLIDALAGTLTGEGDWDMVTAAAPLQDPVRWQDPSIVKVVCDADDRALYFSRAPIPYIREKDGVDEGKDLYLRHIGIYGYRRSFLTRLVRTPPSALELCEKLEQLRALHIGGRIRVVRVLQAGVGVDEPKDVPAAEAALRSAGLA